MNNIEHSPGTVVSCEYALKQSKLAFDVVALNMEFLNGYDLKDFIDD